VATICHPATFRKPMWHHTKIKRLIQEIKNHVCSVWTGLTQQKPSLWDLLGLLVKATQTDTGRTRPLLLQHKVCKLSARSSPCTKVCTKTSLSRHYTLCFCIKQYNFHLLITVNRPLCAILQTGVLAFNSDHLWHQSHFPWTTAFTCTFATSILWCYNFNGMIKWYDILCATLYIYDNQHNSLTTTVHITVKYVLAYWLCKLLHNEIVSLREQGEKQKERNFPKKSAFMYCSLRHSVMKLHFYEYKCKTWWRTTEGCFCPVCCDHCLQTYRVGIS